MLVPNVGSAVAGVGVTAPLWVGLLVGIAFGIPASLWGIGNPETVIRTGRLVDRLLIGCFASVTAFGAVLLYGLHAVGLPMHFDPKPLYVYSGAIGGVNFGIGAAIGGYFPGTEWIALGEGRAGRERGGTGPKLNPHPQNLLSSQFSCMFIWSEAKTCTTIAQQSDTHTG